MDYFPELFKTVQFWEMKKLPTAGFSTPTELRSIRVIVLNRAGNAIKRKKLLNEWVLDLAGNDVMYSYDDSDVRQGSYFNHPFTGELNIVVQEMGYSNTGGMKVWGIQRVQGEDYQDPKTLAPVGGVF